MGSWGKSSEEILLQQFPLHRACRDGDVQTVSALLGDQNELGPANDLFQEDAFYGWTPAHWAAYFGKLPCLVRLIEHGEVSCNISTFRFHQSPLHIAAFGGHGHCLQWLLSRGAQINRQDYLGETALHKAARTGSMECVSLLVAQGAKLSATNFSHQIAAELAVNCGFVECAKYLDRARELQQPAKGIFQDLLPPAPLAPAIAPTESHHNPDSQQMAVISQGLNGGSIPHTLNNGTVNGISHEGMEDEDDMDTGEGTVTEGKTEGMSVFGGAGGRGDGVSNGDVLLNNGVVHNHIPIAGRKRGREDLDIDCLKRIRCGDADEVDTAMFSVDGVEAVTVQPTKFMNPNFGQITPLSVPLPSFTSNNLSDKFGHSGNLQLHNGFHGNQTSNGLHGNQASNGFHGNQTSNEFHGNQTSNGFHGSQQSNDGNQSGNGFQDDQQQCDRFQGAQHTSNGLHGNQQASIYGNQLRSEMAAFVTTSALEHHKSVNMQLGYDSLMVESLIAPNHGS